MKIQRSEGRRLSHHRPQLGERGAERYDADILAEQFGARHRSHPRIP
jgi:hypothetical protein